MIFILYLGIKTKCQNNSISLANDSSKAFSQKESPSVQKVSHKPHINSSHFGLMTQYYKCGNKVKNSINQTKYDSKESITKSLSDAPTSKEIV